MQHDHKKKNNEDLDETPQNNTGKKGVDKSPGEEQQPDTKLTDKDLKGKKVDADPEKESDKPLDQQK